MGSIDGLRSPVTESFTSPRWKAAWAWGGGRAALLRERSRALSLCLCFCGPVWWPAEAEPVVCIGRQAMFRMSVGSCPVFPPRLLIRESAAVAQPGCAERACSALLVFIVGHRP